MKTDAAARVGTAESRINARLDAQSAQQLHYLTTTTGLGISEVVRASLAHYYRVQRLQDAHALPHLTPLVGRYRSGRVDTSLRVKQVAAEYLETKPEASGKKPPREASGSKAARR